MLLAGTNRQAGSSELDRYIVESSPLVWLRGVCPIRESSRRSLRRLVLRRRVVASIPPSLAPPMLLSFGLLWSSRVSLESQSKQDAEPSGERAMDASSRRIGPVWIRCRSRTGVVGGRGERGEGRGEARYNARRGQQRDRGQRSAAQDPGPRQWNDCPQRNRSKPFLRMNRAEQLSKISQQRKQQHQEPHNQRDSVLSRSNGRGHEVVDHWQKHIGGKQQNKIKHNSMESRIHGEDMDEANREPRSRVPRDAIVPRLLEHSDDVV